MNRKFMLDTNFLVAPFQHSFSLFEDLNKLYPFSKLYTMEEAVQEAKSIENGQYKDLVPKLLAQKDVEILSTEGDGEVDDLLVDQSDRFIIATNDKELKKRIRQKGNPVLIIRQKNHLEIEGTI